MHGMGLILHTQVELEDLLADEPQGLREDIPRMHWAHVAIAFALTGCGAFLVSFMHRPDLQLRMPDGWLGFALRCVPPAMLSYGLTTIGKFIGLADSRAFAWRMRVYAGGSFDCAKRWRDTAHWYADLVKQRGLLPECEVCERPARNLVDDMPRCDKHNMPGYWTGLAAQGGP